MSEYTITMTIDTFCNGVDGEMDVTVTGDVSPFRAGNRSGHPDTWEPDEGGEVEITKVVRPDGAETSLNSKEEERAEQMLRDAAGDDDSCLDYDDEPDYSGDRA